MGSFNGGSPGDLHGAKLIGDSLLSAMPAPAHHPAKALSSNGSKPAELETAFLGVSAVSDCIDQSECLPVVGPDNLTCHRFRAEQQQDQAGDLLGRRNALQRQVA